MELMKKLEKLIDVLTAYYTILLNDRNAGAPAPAVKPVKEKKTKAETSKPEAPAPIAAAAQPAPGPQTTPDAGPVLSAEDSLKEIRAVAKVYVQRFGNQADGLAAFRKIMADKCGVGKIDDLKHEQRLVVIAAVKIELAKGDAEKPALAAAAATTGTEV